MKVAFLAANKAREKRLARAFVAGARRAGDEAEVRGNDTLALDCDAVAVVGVKSLGIFRAHLDAGVSVIMLDKGYLRHRLEGSKDWEYWRVAVNAHHPTLYVAEKRHPVDRLQALELNMRPLRRDGQHIVFAGSSEKYHRFYDLPHPTEYAQNIVARLREYTDRPIHYRPKPSWRGAEPIDGTIYSREERIEPVLRNAWAMVTHGSNACFEAALMGIPSVILGYGVARPISSVMLDEIERPKFGDRGRWLANLAYCQWTIDEFANGKAWKTIRPQITGDV